jgi:hypothetical protein
MMLQSVKNCCNCRQLGGFPMLDSGIYAYAENQGTQNTTWAEKRL